MLQVYSWLLMPPLYVAGILMATAASHRNEEFVGSRNVLQTGHGAQTLVFGKVAETRCYSQVLRAPAICDCCDPLL